MPGCNRSILVFDQVLWVNVKVVLRRAVDILYFHNSPVVKDETHPL